MTVVAFPSPRPLDVAVIGSGVSGLSAAWLLSKAHRVTLYEKDDRPGGHVNTVDLDGGGAVDTGFIVYNEANYPNLTALFAHLGVKTRETDMSFAASLENGRIEYGGHSLSTLFAQKTNLLRPRFWRMAADIPRFYREAPKLLDRPEAADLSLGEFLARGGYSKAFVEDHLLPMAAAIWSASADTLRDHPAASFVRFCQNHGLLRLTDRPVWRTVEGGGREYVRRLLDDAKINLLLGAGVERVFRADDKVTIRDRRGEIRNHDHVIFATHADQALALLDDPTPQERAVLGAFRFQRNVAVLHTDETLMPRRRKVWSSWNYLTAARSAETGDDPSVCVTYWMNKLQGFLPPDRDFFVTLNPVRPPRDRHVLRAFLYDHPVFDAAAAQAQARLTELWGERRTWCCGAWFGSGFHEDGLQAGLAAAEALGGVRRPWRVADESGRIRLSDGKRRRPAPEAAA